MWQTECIKIIRHMVDDLSSTPTYSQDRLEELFLVAAQLVKQDIVFGQVYTIDVDQLTLSPDPTEPTRDENFINLVCLKAACMLDFAAARTAAGQAIAIKDGSSSIDLKGTADNRFKFLKEGWCKKYDQAVIDYDINSNQVAGAAIMSPFKTIMGTERTRY